MIFLLTLAWPLILVSLIAYAIYWIKQHNPSVNYKELDNKNVIITGASTGIGEQIAYEIAKGKANMLITGLEDDLLSQIATKCKQLGCKSIEYIALDLSTTSNSKLFVEKCLSTFKDGKINYLFLNHAYIGPYKEWINKNNLNEFEKNMDKNMKLTEITMPINISSHIMISTLLYKYLEENKSSLIYTASLAGYGIQPYVSVYSASKHGARAFFENWRLELNMNECKMSITICKLALVATKASAPAIPILSQSVSSRAADPNYVAKRIIAGGQMKLRYVYAPFMDAVSTCVISKISKTMYSAITCKANYRRFW
eukprot:127803_1